MFTCIMICVFSILSNPNNKDQIKILEKENTIDAKINCYDQLQEIFIKCDIIFGVQH